MASSVTSEGIAQRSASPAMPLHYIIFAGVGGSIYVQRHSHAGAFEGSGLILTISYIIFSDITLICKPRQGLVLG
jgi:hypothetical protein